MKKTKSFLLSFILLSFLTTATSAEDFTFIVPVQIVNLHPDITKGRINCSASKFQPGPSPDPIWEEHSQEFNIVNGNFNSTFTIKFNLFQGKNPAEARFWKCVMDLYSTTLGWRVANFQFDDYIAGGPYKWDGPNSNFVEVGQIPTGTDQSKPQRKKIIK